jgi:hypothetical protein
LAAPPLAAQPTALEEVLTAHTSRYPEMQPVDLYKLLHQAALGSEHAASEPAGARQWLLTEIETLADSGDDSFDEPLTEPLSPDGRLVRVNLRPYLRAGRDLGGLLEAFLQTAQTYQGDPTILESYCDRAIELARQGSLPFAPVELAALFETLRDQGYPAVHHSQRYADAYHPAYRVVLREVLAGE